MNPLCNTTAIAATFSVGNLPVREPKKLKPSRRPAWYKAEQEQIDNYTMELHDRLETLTVPQSLDCSDCHCADQEHGQERDSFVLDLMTAIIETSHQTIPLSGSGRSSSDPSKNCFIEKSIPGWREHVDPYKQDAIFWHAIWQSSGRPNQGIFKEMMVKTRNQFHYAVRRTKKMSNAIRARSLLEAGQHGSVNLLKEMKSIKGSKKSSANLPDNVAGVSGE